MGLFMFSLDIAVALIMAVAGAIEMVNNKLFCLIEIMCSATCIWAALCTVKDFFQVEFIHLEGDVEDEEED